MLLIGSRNSIQLVQRSPLFRTHFLTCTKRDDENEMKKSSTVRDEKIIIIIILFTRFRLIFLLGARPFRLFDRYRNRRVYVGQLAIHLMVRVFVFVAIGAFSPNLQRTRLRMSYLHRV